MRRLTFQLGGHDGHVEALGDKVVVYLDGEPVSTLTMLRGRPVVTDHVKPEPEAKPKEL